MANTEQVTFWYFAVINIAILFKKCFLHYRNLANHEGNKHFIFIFSIKLSL